MTIKNTIALFVMVFIWLTGNSQEKEEAKGTWEFSPSYIYSYAPSISEGLFKTEFHVTYWITEEWGGGISYTHKFIDAAEINDDIAVIGSWNPKRFLTLNLGLNYTIPKGEEGGFWGAYNEAEINFRPKKWLAFGPVVGSVLSKKTEVYGGVHVAFEF